MSASVTFAISGTAREDLEKLRGRAPMEAINKRVGGMVQLLIYKHLAAKELEGNKNGWPTQHFYANAAKSMHNESNADRVRIVISQVGFRQRIEGGTIRAVDSKYLTIPARAEAYGRRARDIENLKVQFGKRKDGSIGPVALVVGEGGASIFVAHGREAAGGKRPVIAEEGLVMFWLVKEVNQKPDPTVLPTDEEIQATAGGAITAYLDLTLRRAA